MWITLLGLCSVLLPLLAVLPRGGLSAKLSPQPVTLEGPPSERLFRAGVWTPYPARLFCSR